MFSLHSFSLTRQDILAISTNKDSVKDAAAWILLGVFGGLFLDLCAKELLQTYSLVEFVLVRSAIAIVIFLALARPVFGGLAQLRTSRWRWHLLRTTLAAGAMFGFFYGLSLMPLVNALTLGFTAPLMVTALSVPFLKEHVGWRRWLAVIVGFIGVLVMLRPGSSEFTMASGAVLFAAFCYATQAITARYLGNTESTLSLIVYVVAGPMMLAMFLLDETSWVTPDASGWALMLGAGVGSVIAWVGLVNGYRKAPPALLAPLEYTALVGGAIAGYVFWSEIPDRWVVIGAGIIIGSGLYVVYREIKTQNSAKAKVV